MKIIQILPMILVLFCCNTPTKNNTAEESKNIQAQIDSVFNTKAICKFDSISSKDFSFESSLDNVLIVSYKFQRQGFVNTDKNPEKQLVKDNKMVWNEFNEQIQLNKSQKNTLKKLIFNYSATGLLLMPAADCYFPRHCIYFLDKRKNVLGYIEFCFECNRHISSSKELELISCQEQFDEFKIFMKNCGLKKGFDIDSMDPNSYK